MEDRKTNQNDTLNDKESANTDTILKAMDIYLSEYIHRDTHMWSLNFKFFFASLIVMLLPNLVKYFNIDIPEILSKMDYFFPIFGIVIAFIFLYNSIALTRRFQAVSNTYAELINQLPENLQRKKINQRVPVFLKKFHTFLTPFLMFAGLLILGILLIIQK